MNAVTLDVARTGDAPTRRATSHACVRYAQRVLGLSLDEHELRRRPALRSRCERGIARLLERASFARKEEHVEVWVARTRALVVSDSCVITVLVAPTSKGFGKRFYRARSGEGTGAAVVVKGGAS
jgi:hypothetical protein